MNFSQPQPSTPFSHKLRTWPGAPGLDSETWGLCSCLFLFVILAQPESPSLPGFGCPIHAAFFAAWVGFRRKTPVFALPEGAGGFSPLNKANRIKGL